MSKPTARFFEIVAGGRFNTTQEWHEYLEAFHAELPHANELFTLLRTFSGETSYRVLAKSAASTGARRVLDIGCGDGNLIEELLEAFPSQTEIAGIDISEAEIAIAANRYSAQERVCLQVGDARALPYADESFDCVVAHQFLNLLPDIQPYLREAARVLQRGRSLVFIANRGWQSDQTASWMLLHQAAMQVVKQQYPDFVWPRMGDMRIYNEAGIREIFQTSGDWDMETLQMETFNTNALMSPDRVAVFYNRLYLFGTAPAGVKDGVLEAVERRGREAAVHGRLEIDLPFRLIRIQKARPAGAAQ